LLSSTAARAETERLTSRPRKLPSTVAPLTPGTAIRTEAGQRRRVVLPGGSILFVDENSQVRLRTPHQLVQQAGEIFVEAGAAPERETFALEVVTPSRVVRGSKADFGVRLDSAGARVLVTRGQAVVARAGKQRTLAAGQQLAADSNEPTRAPRASHLLAWTRDLRTAAEAPLVPGSQHAGGSLLARDPNGQEASLSLRKFHIDVHVEDGFARTTIDQTYFNDSNWQLEGTFYFPLPPDASLSRLAMYVDGNLMEGGMAERDRAREVYETIRYTQRDPALLEWVDGSTFKMRVFPLEPRQEKRIVLSYSQKLPALYGQATYRFPAGHSLQTVRDWSFHARVKAGADLAWASASHTLTASKDGADLVLDVAAKNAALDRDVVLSLAEPAPPGETVRFSAAEQDGARYLMLRYRPGLTVTSQRAGDKHWVFLFEASGDRDPLLARVQIELIRELLNHIDPQDTFTVLTAGTRVRAWRAEPEPVTPSNIQSALAFLEAAHLVGALDLGRALIEAGAAIEDQDNAYVVHVGSGIAAMGERRADVLTKHLPANARYIGVGVGRRWARGFMKTLAERSGGHFTQVNPDESIAWRGFDLFATLNTPRLLNLQVEDAAGKAAFLPFVQALAQGEELAAVTRIDPGAPLPDSVTVRGTLSGQPFERVLPVKDVAERADYLPRTWAKLEIDRLLAEDALKHKERIVALSKAMYVMTPFTSLLVLENEDLYTQYKVDRGRQDHWAMYPCPRKIPVVVEPDPRLPKGMKTPKTAKQELETVVVRQPPRFLGKAELAQDQERSKRMADLGRSSIVGVDSFPESEAVVDFPPILKSRAFSATAINNLGDMQIFSRDRAILQRHQSMFMAGLDEHPGQPASISERVDLPAADLVLPQNVTAQVASDLPAGETIRLAKSPHTARLFAKKMDVNRFLEEPDFQEFTHELTPVAAADLGLVRLGGLERSMDARSARNAGRGFRHGADSDEDLSILYMRDIREAVEGKRNHASSLLYWRPKYSDDNRLFSDLLIYAPGMNTSRADLEAVLEAEAMPDAHARPGQVDTRAGELLAQARVPGWQALAFPGQETQPPYTIFFDGSGRYAFERNLPLGLKERVVCDGKTLLHLYPDLAVGARRAVSRFHRSAFWDLVPWAVPPAEDLAHGVDLKIVGQRTIALVPHQEARLLQAIKKAEEKKQTPKLSWLRVHLVFGNDGRLGERQLVRMPAQEIISRETIAADGVVRLLDAKGQELWVRKATLREATAPDLDPSTKGLVVLALPYRTTDHVKQTLKIEKIANPNLRFQDALPLLAAEMAAGNTKEATAVFMESFHAREQRALGFYVLLAACGANLDGQAVDVLAEHGDEPLAQYLALHSSPVLRKHASQWAAGSGSWGQGFLNHLGVSHALYQRWQDERIAKVSPARRQAERQRALEYINRNKGSVFGWVLLTLLQDRAGDDKEFHRTLVDAWHLFEDVPGLAYAARYEQARSLLRSGQRDEARKAFRLLYEATLKEDQLPAIDPDFRQALLGDGDQEPWNDLVRKTAGEFIQQKHRSAVLALAWQCWQLDDQPLANHLLGAALDGAEKNERTALTLAGIEFLSRTAQLAEADRLLRGLLADPKLAKNASLWRLGAKLAERRELTDRALECLDQALEAEYRSPPARIDLQQVRQDYGKLLAHYQNLADAMVTLKITPPPDFLARAVRTADRWRALDTDATAACQEVARLVRKLGDSDLSWDYLTTPLGLRPNDAAPWMDLAGTLRRTGDLDLADRAFEAAYASEPTNAQILWDRADNLRQTGKNVEARQLLRQIADGRWQPRFQGLQVQARLQLR
jgi:hypothetical protein